MGGKATESKRFGCYSLILRGVGFSQDSFFSFQRAGRYDGQILATTFLNVKAETQPPGI